MTDEYKQDKDALRFAIKQALRQTLEERMTESDLTPSMLSEFAGLIKTSVSCLLHTTYAPNVVTLCRLAKVLRCTLDDLIPKEVYL